MKITYVKLSIFILATILILPSGFALASKTNGTIDTTYKHAWSENMGWINFGCANCNVTITDSGMTGYAWSSSYGWINLSPSGSGVINDSKGILSGQAWGENTGWINFDGVTIDNLGYFSGYANGIVTGQLSFNCSNTNSCAASNFKVRTDWRPTSAKVKPISTKVSVVKTKITDGSGGGIVLGMFNLPKAPLGGFKVIINGGIEITNRRMVNLSFRTGSNIKKIEISNTGDFNDASQNSYTSTKQWDLCSKFNNAIKLQDCKKGKHTVYVKFYTRFGQSSQIFSNSIIYTPQNQLEEQPHQTPMVVSFKRNLHLKDTGEEVKRLQQFLNQNGFIVGSQGPGSPKNETAYFGHSTLMALKQFQRRYKREILTPIGLTTATGFFGLSTRRFVNIFLSKQLFTGVLKTPRKMLASQKIKERGSVFLPTSTRTLRFGMQGNEVKILQQLLNFNIDTRIAEKGLGSKNNETSYFGSLTRDAVKRFQTKYGIVSFGNERTTGYGLVGPKTLTKFNEILGDR